MNARFWQWVNGDWVKLTLRPDQELRHSSFRWTDEGWSRESLTWRHDGDCIVREWLDEGRDCDGYTSQYGEQRCPLELLADSEGTDGVRMPTWELLDRECRDEYAELAGY